MVWIHRPLGWGIACVPLHMKIFQSRHHPSPQKCHFGEFHRVENNLLGFVQNIRAAFGFGLKENNAHRWSASSCINWNEFYKGQVCTRVQRFNMAAFLNNSRFTLYVNNTPR